MAQSVFLGVNIDHVATLRQARRAAEPSPLQAAAAAERGGADGITVHLRSDRRHIQDTDVEALIGTVSTHLNVEMAATEEMLRIAMQLRPHAVSLVPERPEELTTEGGLDVAADPRRLRDHVGSLQQAGISVAVFIDPDRAQVDACAGLGVQQIEINTAAYADSSEAGDTAAASRHLRQVRTVAEAAAAAGLRVAAGHGLTYRNVGGVVAIAPVVELNIGHNIVARAVMVGMETAVREMKDLLRRP